MLISDIVFAQFTSSSTARDTYVMLGFVPDFALVITDYGNGKLNDLHWWGNHASLSQWGATLALLQLGSTGVMTGVANSDITAYAGGDHILLDPSGLTSNRFVNGVDTTEDGPETVDSNPKHVDQNGAPVTNIATGSTTGPLSLTTSNEFITQAGLKILNGIQANSGLNLVIAFRGNR